MADYSPVSLVEHVHSIPHISKSLKVLDDSQTSGAGLDITNMDYDSSLGTMGVLLGLLGVIAFVIICVYACCCSKKRGYYSLAERKGSYTRKAAIVCCIIISLLAIGISVTNSFVDKKISTISDDMDSIKDTYNNNINAANDTASSAMNVVTLLAENPLPAACQQSGIAMSNDMSTLSSSILNVSSTAPTIDFTSTDLNLIHKVNMYRSIGMYSFSGLIGLLSLLLACTRVRNGCVILLFAFCFVGSWLLASAQFSFAIGSADICYDPSPFVARLLGNSTDIRYYLECSTDIPFPWSDQFDQANALMTDANNIYTTVLNTTGCEQYAHFDVLRSYLDDVSARLSSLDTNVHCDGPHDQYVSFLNTVCHDAYQLFAYMEMCQVVQALVFCFALGFAVNVWKHRNDMYGDDDDATTPLLGSASSIQRGRERETPISNEPFRFSKPMRGATDLYQDKTPSPVCGVCQDRPISTILRPCNHTICQQCSRQISVCPWCRKDIVERASIYI